MIFPKLDFFGGGRDLNPEPCIFYVLSKPTELSSRGLPKLDLIIFVSFVFCRWFYVINIDVVSLFIDSSFLFLTNLNLCCINIFFQFDWMIIVLGHKIKSNCWLYCMNIIVPWHRIPSLPNDEFEPMKILLEMSV
jgi:hypothetical protein